MAKPEVETMILRFRDLSTEPGGTIKSHCAKIDEDERGYTWWGWWNKAGEKVPTAVFPELTKKASKGGLVVYLFDSGRDHVYEATCTEIRWELDLESSESPEAEATPAYYQPRKYKAWFKLSSISADPIDTSVLQEWSYERVDDFFETTQSRYDRFYGKRVHSAEELRQQDRTIWFVREFRDGDATHEISLLDPHTITPADFPQEFRVSDSRHFLWLSDLHFSNDGHHGFPDESDEARTALWQAIEDALKNKAVVGEGADKVAGVLMSGDFTWKAEPSEFQKARNFIGELSSKLVLRNYDYLACPGNHDIPFSTEPWEDAQPVTQPPATATAAYRDFLEKLFYIQPNEFLASGRRVIAGRVLPVEFAALNSQLLDQKQNLFQGHGFVGQRQLQFVAEQMGWNQPLSDQLPVRVVMLHHHLLPVNFRELPVAGANYSVALDAEAIVRWIVEHRVKIVLHGHRHDPFYVKLTRESKPGKGDEHEFWVLGLGSSGVGESDLGEVKRNTIGLLTFARSSVRFKVISIHPVNPADILWEIEIRL